ncbi:TonB family protein [Stenotrophomonas maltophilia R551-3]|uniref:TonB family protein n=2 Tax=Stenotrophomonas maltophilia TaxID=40324 RepID=B4SHN0_STRM5|nr:TonB family protein [Stenotrophomonas maltophilia R551-3]
MPTILAGRLEGFTHALSPATTTSAWARPAGPSGSQPGDSRYAGSAPEWIPRMPRLNAALALNLALMLLSATHAMAMAADLQVSTEVFVEAGDNPSFKLRQAPAIEYSTAPATSPDTFLQAPMAVLLVAQLDELGHVSNVMVARSSGLREMDRAALTAVDQWRFDPVVVEGIAQHARVRVRLTFVATTEAPPG